MEGSNGNGQNPRIAVIVPCLNEALTVQKVVRDFQTALPGSTVYVVDNASTDGTADLAAAAGAVVIREGHRGKGHAVRTAFRAVDADAYLMVDGDDTYPAESARDLLTPVLEGRADMTVGSRMMPGSRSDFPMINRLGNILYARFLGSLLGARLTDVLSGYRGMSREFVKQVPIVTHEFEIEVELTVKAIERGYRLEELPISLRSRPPGSSSKLRIFRDGYRITTAMLLLFRDYRPFTVFGLIGLILMLSSLIPGTIVVREFSATGTVPRLPSAVLAVGLMLSGMFSVGIGLILDAISRRFLEVEFKLDAMMAQAGAIAFQQTRRPDPIPDPHAEGAGISKEQ